MSQAPITDSNSGTLAADLRDLVDSLAHDSDEKEQYVEYAGLYVPSVNGHSWNRGSTVGRVGRTPSELTRSVRDAFGRLRGSGRDDLLVNSIDFGQTGRVIPQPHFYFWRIPTQVEPIPSILAWAVTSHESSSGFSPLILRQLATTAAALVRRYSVSHSGTLAMLDLATCGDASGALELVCSATRAKSAILWEFNYSAKLYSSVRSYGIDGWRGEQYQVQVGGTKFVGQHGQLVRRGVVGLLTPETELVIYDSKEPESWSPRTAMSWVPHDAELFQSQRWRSCVAWPILSSGLLVGALSVYSDGPARNLQFGSQVRIGTCSAFQGLLRAETHDRDLARVERQLSDEVDRIGISLMALGHVHDFADRISSARSAIEQARLALQVGDIGQTQEEVLKISSDLSMLSDLTESLKRLSRESSGRSGQANARDVILGIEGFLRTFVKREGRGRVDISFNIPDSESDLYRCSVDALRLERIIVNLVSNATYWTKADRVRRGHVTLSLYSVTRDDGNQVVFIEVADNGVGMTAEVQSRVFDRFYSRRTNGTGMGLYFAKKFVEEAGGTVTVESEPGSSTRFQIQLPNAGRRDVK